MLSGIQISILSFSFFLFHSVLYSIFIFESNVLFAFREIIKILRKISGTFWDGDIYFHFRTFRIIRMKLKGKKGEIYLSSFILRIPDEHKNRKKSEDKCVSFGEFQVE